MIKVFYCNRRLHCRRFFNNKSKKGIQMTNKPDKEMRVMRSIIKLLNSLPQPARQRVAQYSINRAFSPNDTAEQDVNPSDKSQLGIFPKAVNE
jgi:hypothetical protein